MKENEMPEKRRRKEFSVRKLDEGQLDMMFNFLRFGYQDKPHIPILKEHLDAIRQAMIQKSGGNRPNDPEYYTDHDDIGTHINCVVVEAMCLYLSGALDELERLEGAGNGK